MFGNYLFIGMVIFAVIYAMGGFRDKDGNDSNHRAIARKGNAPNGEEEPAVNPNPVVEEWKETCRRSEALLEEFDRCQRESIGGETTGGQE